MSHEPSCTGQLLGTRKLSSSIPLTQAVTSGDVSAVSALLAQGADVNGTTSGGQTALILAVIFGHTNLIRLLVRAGADPNLRDNLGLNAIEWAQRRGLTEALEILTSRSVPNTATEGVIVNLEEPREFVAQAPPIETEKPENVSSDEKSRLWVAGLKQRLDELEVRRLNRNEPPPGRPAVEEPPPPMTPPSTPVAEKALGPTPAKVEPVIKNELRTGRIITTPPEIVTPTSKRKRCPKCNAIYNGELVSYCAHHIVKLVDADEPIISTPPKGNPPLFWIMVVITLAGSIVIGSLLTTYLYKSNSAATRTATAPQSNIQKALPKLGAELTGKAVSLPEAQCPVSGPEPLTGTVTVRVMVDRKGQVYRARASGGDWLMRGAATEAAMKSTFSPEKLRGETEGTITYTFKP